MSQATNSAAKESVKLRMVSGDEEGRKRVEKTEVGTHNVDTLRYIERKMQEKGVQRAERRPADGLSLRHNPKSGHGGKYTWEGPGDIAENELADVPPAIDEGDPNYVDEGEGEKEEDSGGLVVGEVDVAKVAETKEGVSRVEVRPPLQV
ncbi:hypothetical protein H6P81_003528 [Aristolochia fimbriata]|uniref:Uncharacterized protein n=1 Tax=Aristolochia fimbriata TaxID=158543 RepID=A0AAV7FCU3_ARIFI|nr:hypothetical protein H6P81_003528 [Aristolochia fimbriata]